MSVSFPAVYEQVRRQLGKTRQVSIGKIARRDFQRFAIACENLNPLFFDDGFAQTCGYPGEIAPPLYLSSMMGLEAGPPQEELRADGTPAADATSLAMERLRLMGGGQQLEFHRPVTEGTEAVMEFSVSNVELKQGRSGPIILIEVEKKYRDGAGQLLVLCRENFIAR